MQIQLNSDKHMDRSPGLQEHVERVLAQELKHLAERVTRIEVHFNDESGGKTGDNDKRCQLEARVAGMQPISVEHRASSIHLALNGAAEQLARALQTSQGKAESGAKKRESIRHIEPGESPE